jgi:sugar phosphate isomerase/epimerase
MHRREFFQLTAGALLASGGAAFPRMRLHAQSPLKVDIYSRHLQWLRTADEVAEAAIEMGFDGVNVTVRPYPGHVDPDKVAAELPPFVNALRQRGLLVRSITTNIADADAAAERTVAAAAALGITHYWWGTYRYDLKQPIAPQLEALRPRVAKIAALSEKYRMTAAYHTYSMPATVGSVMWDLLSLLREHDPKYVGFHYDTGHEAHHINGLWEVNLRAADRYIVALAVKDYAPEQNLGLRGEGGPYTGPPGGAGGRGDGQRGGGRGGRGGADAASTWAAGNAWRTRAVPLGMGLVNLPQLAAALNDIHFAGPIEIQAEYPNGGADSAQDHITLPRAQVLGAMKRDLLTLRRGFGSAM